MTNDNTKQTIKHPQNGRELKAFEIDFFGEKETVYVLPVKNNFGIVELEVCYLEGESLAPFGTLTSRVGSGGLDKKGYGFVKNYSENQGWAEGLAKQIGRPTGESTQAGYVRVPLYQFDIEKCYADNVLKPSAKEIAKEQFQKEHHKDKATLRVASKSKTNVSHEQTSKLRR